MYKYILWDHDGVLVDTEYWYFQATRQALSEINTNLEKSTYMKYMIAGKSCWDLADGAGIGTSTIEKKRADRDRYYQRHLLEENIEIPGVEKILGALAKNYKMAIVTTSKRRDFDLIHQQRNITSYMEFVTTREDYTNSKPDPEPYLYGLKKLGAKKSDTLVIEDSQRGLSSARAAGIDCAMVHNDFTASHDFSGAKFFLKSLQELPDLLRQSGRSRSTFL